MIYSFQYRQSTCKVGKCEHPTPRHLCKSSITVMTGGVSAVMMLHYCSIQRCSAL